jgi:hypothetical protein
MCLVQDSRAEGRNMGGQRVAKCTWRWWKRKMRAAKGDCAGANAVTGDLVISQSVLTASSG